MNIQRTEQGSFVYQGWECMPGKLSSGSKLTVRECLAVLFRLGGKTQREAGEKMGCSARTVADRWNTLYYKLGMPRGDALIAINKLIDEGVLHRLALAALSVFILGASVSIDGDRDMDARVVRTARGTRRNEADGLPLELVPVLDGRYA